MDIWIVIFLCVDVLYSCFVKGRIVVVIGNSVTWRIHAEEAVNEIRIEKALKRNYVQYPFTCTGETTIEKRFSQ